MARHSSATARPGSRPSRASRTMTNGPRVVKRPVVAVPSSSSGDSSQYGSVGSGRQMPVSTTRTWVPGPEPALEIDRVADLEAQGGGGTLRQGRADVAGEGHLPGAIDEGRVVLDGFEGGELDEHGRVVAGRPGWREGAGPGDPGDLATDGQQRLLELGRDARHRSSRRRRARGQFDEDRPICGRSGRERLAQTARGHGLPVERRGSDERDRTHEQGPCRDDDRQIRAAAVQDGAPQADRVDQRVSSDVRERVGCRRPDPAAGSASPPASRLHRPRHGSRSSLGRPPAAGPCPGGADGAVRR